MAVVLDILTAAESNLGARCWCEVFYCNNLLLGGCTYWMVFRVNQHKPSVLPANRFSTPRHLVTFAFDFVSVGLPWEFGTESYSKIIKNIAINRLMHLYPMIGLIGLCQSERIWNVALFTFEALSFFQLKISNVWSAVFSNIKIKQCSNQDCSLRKTSLE